MDTLERLEKADSKYRDAIDNMSIAIEACVLNDARYGDENIAQLCKAYERLGYASGYKMGLIDREVNK